MRFGNDYGSTCWLSWPFLFSSSSSSSSPSSCSSFGSRSISHSSFSSPKFSAPKWTVESEWKWFFSSLFELTSSLSWPQRKRFRPLRWRQMQPARCQLGRPKPDHQSGVELGHLNKWCQDEAAVAPLKRIITGKWAKKEMKRKRKRRKERRKLERMVSLEKNACSAIRRCCSVRETRWLKVEIRTWTWSWSQRWRQSWREE